MGVYHGKLVLSFPKILITPTTIFIIADTINIPKHNIDIFLPFIIVSFFIFAHPFVNNILYLKLVNMSRKNKKSILKKDRFYSSNHHTPNFYHHNFLE